MKLKLSHNSEFVNFVPRLVAYGIDVLISYLPLLFIVWSLSQISSLEAFIVQAVTYLFVILVPSSFLLALLNPWFLSHWGMTVGKWSIGAEVTKSNGTFLTLRESIFREWFAKTVNFTVFGLSFLLIAFHPKHQSLHDELVGSFVKNKQSQFLRGLLIFVVLVAFSGFAGWTTVQNFSNNTELHNEVVSLFSYQGEETNIELQQSEPFTSQEGQFSVQFPTTPESSTEQVSVSGMDITYTQYIAGDTQGDQYLVQFARYPGYISSDKNDQLILEGSLDGIVRSTPEAKILDSQSIQFQGNNALEATVEVPDGYFKIMNIMSGEVLYTVMVTNTESTVPNYAPFIQSFQISE